MLRSGAARGSERCAQHERHLEFPPGHVVSLGRLIHHLVHRQGDEVAEHDVDDRTHARDGRAYANPGKAGLRYGCINHPAGTKLLDEAREHLERGPCFGNVLAHDEDRGIPAHFLGKGLADSLAERNFSTVGLSSRHADPPRRHRGKEPVGRTPPRRQSQPAPAGQSGRARRYPAAPHSRATRSAT